MEIEINSKKFGKQIILIDADDYEKVKNYSLSIFKNRHNLYVRTSFINGKRYLLHRYLTNAPDDKQVDHINHNTLDNRRTINLRVCSHSENLQNSQKHKISKTSPCKGVQFLNGHFYAFICVNRKQINLGKFKSLELAAKAYNEAALKYHGKFAYLNEFK